AAVVDRRARRRLEEVVGGGAAEVQLLEVLEAVRGGSDGGVLLGLAPPARRRRRRLAVRVVHGERRRLLERDGRPAVVVVVVVRGGVGAHPDVGQAGDDAGAVHVGGAPDGGAGRLRVVRRLLQPPRRAAHRQRAALQDALDVVAAHVKVGDGVEPPELDRRDVVRLRRLLLGAYTQRLSS
ncbi:Os02g0614325, partial [Oryza sativa Japonica Group]